MKLTLTQSDLNNGLQAVQKAVSSKSILPVLSGLLFIIEREYVDICSTDLEMSIKCRLSASADGVGAVVLPARLIGDIVKNLPDSKVELAIDDKSGSVKLTCGQSAFDLKTYPVEDFPKFPELQSEKSISIKGKSLSSAIKQVIRAVSKDETRPVLCGVLLTIEKGRLTMVSTDSYRLSIHEMSVDASADDVKVIIPARCMDEISKFGGEEDVEVGLAKNQIYFKSGNTVVVSRLIEGNFPNYQQLLPDNCELKIKLEKEKLLSALRRVSLLAQNSSLIKIKIDKDKLQVSAMTADIGSAVEDVYAEVSGEGIEIAFNAQYLIDGLSSITEDDIFLELNNPLKPGIVRPAAAQNFLYLAMPVRIG